MNQERPYLVDHRNKPISLGQVNFSAKLEADGYQLLKSERGDDIFLPQALIITHFEPLIEFERLFSLKGNFETFFPWWYSKSLDCYLRIAETTIDIEGEECMVIFGIMYSEIRISGVKDLLNTKRVVRQSAFNAIEFLTVSKSRELIFKSYSIVPSETNIGTMYNDDFETVYSHVVKKLNDKQGKGIVLFHGVAGAGKTHLIKHLTTQVNKRFIFVTANMVDQLTNPSFMPMLISRAGSVLVLEDCENFIEDRKLGRSGNVVSSLLQMTDGILSDILKMQIICTFNNDLTRVDPALLREGRLIAEYEFKELEEKKWINLVRNKSLKGKRTLANAFNSITLKTEKPEKKTIGF